MTHDFLVRNDGGAKLIVDRLRAACGCTASAIPPVIEPSGTATIQVSCDTDRLSGKVTRTVTVYSNDPQQPVQTLILNAQVRAYAAVTPPQLYVGHVRPGGSIREELTVTGGSKGGVVQTSGIVDAAWVTGDDPSTTRLHLSVQRNAPPGRFTATLRIPTGNPRRPHRIVPIVGTVDPPNA